MEQTCNTQRVTCDGCRFDRDGLCHDWVVYGPAGGDLLTDDGPRLCYESLDLVQGVRRG